jgi:hypothetical protein
MLLFAHGSQSVKLSRVITTVGPINEGYAQTIVRSTLRDVMELPGYNAEMTKQDQFLYVVQTAVLTNAINLTSQPELAEKYRHLFSASGVLGLMNDALGPASASQMISVPLMQRMNFANSCLKTWGQARKRPLVTRLMFRTGLRENDRPTRLLGIILALEVASFLLFRARVPIKRTVARLLHSPTSTLETVPSPATHQTIE